MAKKKSITLRAGFRVGKDAVGTGTGYRIEQVTNSTALTEEEAIEMGNRRSPAVRTEEEGGVPSGRDAPSDEHSVVLRIAKKLLAEAAERSATGWNSHYEAYYATLYGESSTWGKGKLERLQLERERLNGGFIGNNSFHDGRRRERIEKIDAEIASITPPQKATGAAIAKAEGSK